MPTIKKLHPTLKACKCGFVGTRAQFYKHLENKKLDYEAYKWAGLHDHHGEVPLNEDDPRTKVEHQLKESLQ